MRTNYAGHDALYARKRAEGEAGWCTPEVTNANAATIIAALQRTPLPPGKPVLEVGCGNGQMTLLLARAGLDMHGVDISPSAILWAHDLAREQNQPCTFTVSDVRSLPYPAEAFAAVVDGLCLHCIIGADREVFLREVHRVLAPGGLFVVQTMCGDPPVSLKGQFDPASRCLLHGEGFAGRFLGRPGDIERELERAGFHVLASRVLPPGPSDVNATDMLVVEALRPG